MFTLNAKDLENSCYSIYNKQLDRVLDYIQAAIKETDMAGRNRLTYSFSYPDLIKDVCATLREHGFSFIYDENKATLNIYW